VSSGKSGRACQHGFVAIGIVLTGIERNEAARVTAPYSMLLIAPTRPRARGCPGIPAPRSTHRGDPQDPRRRWSHVLWSRSENRWDHRVLGPKSLPSPHKYGIHLGPSFPTQCHHGPSPPAQPHGSSDKGSSTCRLAPIPRYPTAREDTSAPFTPKESGIRSIHRFGACGTRYPWLPMPRHRPRILASGTPRFDACIPSAPRGRPTERSRAFRFQRLRPQASAHSAGIGAPVDPPERWSDSRWVKQTWSRGGQCEPSRDHIWTTSGLNAGHMTV
jgi:hypothetical protein